MSTITAEDQAKIAAYLETHTLPSGLGSEESACSIAAINLALTGKLTDNIPACMSPVIGRWIIVVQDAMPSDLRNSTEWKHLLPLAAGTGQSLADEQRRLALILDWLWTSVLPHLQPVADKYGFGETWAGMCQEKTVDVAAVAYAAAFAAVAYDAAYAAVAAVAYDAADAAAAAAAADAARAARAAAYAAAHAARAADAARAARTDADAAAATYAATYAYAAYAAARAADAAADADAADARARTAWLHFNPCAMLARLVEA